MSSERAKPLVIDMHNHPLGEMDYVSDLIRTADRLGIDKICLSGLGLDLSSLGGVSPGNSLVLEAMKRYPERIIGFGNIRLGVDGPDKVLELYEQGFKGIKTTRPLKNYDDEEYDLIYNKIEELRLPILFHTGIVLVTPADKYENVSSARMRPIFMDRIARTFPDLKIFIAHLGTPWFDEAAQMARFHKNVYVDITGSPRGWSMRKSPQFFDDLFWWENAWEKLVFGTDVHYNDMEEAKKLYHRILDLNNIPKETQTKIFGETVANMLGI